MASVEQHVEQEILATNGAAEQADAQAPVEAPPSGEIPVENPATGQTIRTVPDLGAEAGVNGNCAALGISLAGGRFSRVGEREVTSLEPRTQKGRPCALDAGVDADAGALLADGGIDCSLVEVTKLVAPAGAVVNGVKDGTVFVGWAGGCAFGPALVGATLTLQTGFTGTRTGDFDPPPYTPAEVVVPDGGFDAETSVDAGP